MPDLEISGSGSTIISYVSTKFKFLGSKNNLRKSPQVLPVHHTMYYKSPWARSVTFGTNRNINDNAYACGTSIYKPKLRFNKPKLSFYKPKLRFKKPKLRFNKPKLRILT